MQAKKLQARCGDQVELNTNITSKEPVIQLKGLSKSFDGKQIITGLDLNVNDGEFLTILGPSGCGKTTVLRLIAGFEDADQGRLLLPVRT